MLLFLRDFVQLLASYNCSIADNATDENTQDLLVELHTMTKSRLTSESKSVGAMWC